MRQIHMLLFLAVCLLTGCAENEGDVIYVGTASNMQNTMERLIKVFEQQTEIDVEIIQGSSGKLSAQIEQGHPIDVFVSADMQYPMHLYRSDLATEKPKIYAYGKLAIISREGIEPTLQSMLDDKVTQISVANPKTAPYGAVAMIALKNSGMLDSIQPKLVFGQNTSQAVQFLDAGAVELGITAKSLVVDQYIEGQTWGEVPDSLYTPLAQGAVLIKRSGGSKDGAREFYNFLTSDSAREILASFGFSLSDPR